MFSLLSSPCPHSAGRMSLISWITVFSYLITPSPLDYKGFLLENTSQPLSSLDMNHLSTF
jgi:hypothetical protein